MARPALIKRYANRRLYNTSTCTYVTRDDLARMVKGGEDFVVTDGKTSEDITGLVLRQIIIEHESRENQSLLPITFLLQLIRFYGDSMRMLVPPYLELSIDSFTREQEKLRRHMSQAFSDSPFAMLEGLARRNMEIFERAIALFSVFAQRDADKPASSSDDTIGARK